MKITVIGCGNSGLIHAAKLLQNQHEVALLKTSSSSNNEFYDIIEQEHGYMRPTVEGVSSCARRSSPAMSRKRWSSPTS